MSHSHWPDSRFDGFFPCRRGLSRRGITLLELMLALAILGTSLAVLAQIAGTGTDAAREARELSTVRLLCQRKISELLLNTTIAPVAVPSSPLPGFDSESTTSYTYSVDVMPGRLDGLLSVRVTVEAFEPSAAGVSAAGVRPLASYAIDRWMIDPTLGLADAEADQQAARDVDGDAAQSSDGSGATGGGGGQEDAS